MDRLVLNNNQKKKIKNILKSEGFNNSQIEVMTQPFYRLTSDDKDTFFQKNYNKEMQKLIKKLSKKNNYCFVKTKNTYKLSKNLNNYLIDKNLSLNNALAIHYYSLTSSSINNLKR